MENPMKNFIMILCLLTSPLTFAYGDDTSDGANTGGNKSSGGYGSGAGGSAAALIAVGAVIYFVRKNNDDESKFCFVRTEKESKFDGSFGDVNYFEDSFSNYSNEFGSSSNKFQINLRYNFN